MLSKTLAATAGVAIAFCAVAALGAAPVSACTAQSGVIVIVDFTAFGGDIERGTVL